MEKECLYCKKIFLKKYTVSVNCFKKRKYCSTLCQGKAETGKNNPAYKGKGFAHCIDCEIKLTSYYSKRCKKCEVKRRVGENHHMWKFDRNSLVATEMAQERWSKRYKDWRRSVCNRDNWKCRINNKDCRGRLEVHHILGFTNHEELRYEINNGITLCLAHHPRARAEEKRLIPTFQELVSVSN